DMPDGEGSSHPRRTNDGRDAGKGSPSRYMTSRPVSSSRAAKTLSGAKEEYTGLLRWRALFFLAAMIGLIILAGVAVTLGSASLSVTDVYVAILSRLLPGHFQTTRLADTIVWGLRLERILLGVVAGMGLSVAGAAMQGILRNPLASEFTLGVSSAACFGAALAIVMGAGFVGGEYLIVGNAFIFAMLSAFTVYSLSRYKGITPETMVLAGIAIMYLFSAMTSFLQYIGHAEECMRWSSG
ncbi:MAG: iron ABC transporter permease, partial [Methanothrix sp.]|nr:iron ABC transporter permease [Methanothrix sp.]